MQSAKEKLRLSILSREEETLQASAPQSPGFGKTAERIRALPSYQAAENALVSPAQILQQARLNLLTDRKLLTLPTPGLQKGFVLLDPDLIPPRKRIAVMRMRQNSPLAKRIPFAEGLKRQIDLIITDALAVGEDGSMLGDGSGHLDLQYAILRELGWVSKEAQIIAFVEEDQIHPSLPMDDFDVGAHWIATPGGVRKTSYRMPPETGVVWDRLSMKQIRRNDALFYLYRGLRTSS